MQEAGDAVLIAVKLSGLLGDGMEEGSLLQMGVGAVQGQVQLSVQGTENHAVAAVVHEKGFNLGEFAVDLAVIRNRHALGIAALGEARPQAEQRAVRRAPQEGAVGHAAADAAGVMLHLAPFCIGGMEEQPGFAGRCAQIVCQGDGIKVAEKIIEKYL